MTVPPVVPGVTATEDPAVVVMRARLQRALGALVLLAVPWLVDPGRVEPDTKLDLVTGVWRYLGRALEAWDAHSGFGQLQNQAYGYLFPMGPVFGVGHWVGLPPWAVQRCWWALLLVVAYLGTERLVRRLGIAEGAPAVVAAVVYALSPRVLTVLGAVSVEAWPLAVCPWLVVVLEPALRPGATSRDRRRAGVLTGLLATAVGGVNATASLAVFAVPLVYLLTAPAGRRRLAVLGWWLGGAALGSAWWLLPLLVLGRDAYPFLDFIETASTTTAVTDLANSVRGTSHWVAFVVDARQRPVWQAGWILGQWALPVLGTTLVAALGLVGLLRAADDERGRHLRRFGATSVVLGLLVLGVAYVGPVSGPQAGSVRGLLDGPLSAFRNVHKGDPLVRLPLVLGLGALLALPSRVVRTWLVVLAASAVAVTPLWDGHLGSTGSFSSVPGYWRSAAAGVDRLAARSGGATLLLPASRFGGYQWGDPGDEPLVSLARSPVVVRNAVPLGAPGSTRLLDAAETLLVSGDAQPSLAAGLARMGVARVALRTDLDATADTDAFGPVGRTLERSPGFARVASYGGGKVVLYTVTAPGRHRVQAYPVATAAAVRGGPESVFALTAGGLVGPGTGVVLTQDDPRAAGVRGPVVLTDSLRRRTLDPAAAVTREYSETLTEGQPAGPGLPAPDLPPAGPGAPETARTFVGGLRVTASSSAADPFAVGYRGPGAGAFAAVDGDPSTSWLSGDEDRSASLRLTFGARHPIGRVGLVLTRDARTARPATVSVSAGGRTVTRPTGRRQTRVVLDLGDVRAGGLVVRLERDVGSPAGPLGVSEVRVPGIRLGTSVRVGPAVEGRPGTVVLSRDPEDGRLLQRSVSVGRAVVRSVSLWVRPAGTTASRTACGRAGAVRVGSRLVRFQAVVSPGQAASGALVRARPCGSSRVTLEAPVTTVRVRAGAGLRPDLVTFGDRAVRTGVPIARRATSVLSWSSRSRTVRADAGPASLLTFAEGYHVGWRAEVDGHALQAVQVDGWRQGFVLPASGAVVVHVVFAPAVAYRTGLLAGAVGVVLLLVAACFLLRRREEPVVLAPGAPEDLRTGGRHPVAGAQLGTTVATVAVSVLLAGLPGLAVALVAAVVPARLRSVAAGVAVTVGGVLLVAGGVLEHRDWGAGSSQLAVLLGVLLLLRAGFLPVPERATQGPLQPAVRHRRDDAGPDEHDEEHRPEGRPED